MVHGRPFLFRITTKDTVVLFYSTLSPQKCPKLNAEKQNEQGHLGSNLTLERKNRNFRKTIVTNSTKDYADLEVTCRDKVTNVGVIVRYRKVIKRKRNLGLYLTPGGLLRVKLCENTKIFIY
jgi:hypothetical protein